MSWLQAVQLVSIFPFVLSPTFGQINITSANYGDARTNANPNESILTQQGVAGGGFGKLGAMAVDGEIYAQPLYVGGVQIPNQGTKNVVFVATMNNSVYAFDADNPQASSPLWQVNLGPAVTAAAIPDLGDLQMQVGILSTPVIDPNVQVIYVVAETFESGAPVFRLHALSLLNGQETMNGPVVISASVPGFAQDAVNGVVTFNPYWHLQRPGLALANGMVYICFGSHGDAGAYHGWVMAYQASNLQQQTAVSSTTPNGNGGGIWQSGHAPMIDASGNIYVVSGNGDFDGVANLSCAVIKLSGTTLAVLDWFVPASWQFLSENDLDVGSTGAISSQGGTLVLAGDKGGRLINLPSAHLGGLESTAGADDFLASTAGIFDLALWQSSAGELLYEHDWNGYLKAYPVTASGITQTPASIGTWLGDSLYQGLAVSSNGTQDGIVWETTGDHSQPGTPGTLHAWSASDLTVELWNSDQQAPDVLGTFVKFVSPLVANGRVYVPTLSNAVVIYGMKSAGVGNANAPQISAVLNGASFLQSDVAPGEMVAILGSNLGPATLETAQPDNSGNFPTSLGGMQVLFDGVAAPLLYASSEELGAVVPFEVNGSTQMVVANGAGQTSAMLPVVAVAPALFTSSGLGTGQASVVNEDGTVNSSSNPAALGSLISLYGTGLGQTTPPGVDGATTVVLAVPNLPVSVLIGGLPAYVVYAGGAPGLVQGTFQINVRVPPLAPTGPMIAVTIQVGNAVSPVDVSIALQ